MSKYQLDFVNDFENIITFIFAAAYAVTNTQIQANEVQVKS